MRLIQTILPLLFLSVSISAQTIIGQFSEMPNQVINLIGYNGYQEITIGSTTTDQGGGFKFSYNESQFGLGHIEVNKEASIMVLLNGETVEIKGQSLYKKADIQVTKGKENKILRQFNIEHPKRLSVLDAWSFLNNYYAYDPQFTQNTNIQKVITEEQNRINDEETTFLNGLEKDSYCYWFLPLNQTISNIPAIAQYHKEQIPQVLNEIRKVNWKDPRLYKSGLLKEIIEGSFWLLISQGRAQEEINRKMNLAIDHFLDPIVSNEKLYQETVSFLYSLFAKRNLISASEYLAVKMINEESCTIDGDITRQLTAIKKMRQGNIAEDIEFSGKLIGPGLLNTVKPTKLSEIQSKYKLVIFGASWCPSCREEIPKLNQHYQLWKELGIQMVLISLDDNEHNFSDFAHSIPAISHCDFQMWEGKAIKDYSVFNTPSLFLIDQDRKILIRPNSVEHLAEWIANNLN